MPLMVDGGEKEVAWLDAVPITELLIDAVEWTDEAVEHITHRAERKGTNELNVEPEWASEAALDMDRIARRASPRSIEVLGWSPSAGTVLKVWLMPRAPKRGEWLGVSACEANRRDQKTYWNTRGGD